MKVLCIGNCSYDITIPVDSYPIENKKIRINDKVVECGGGSSSNCAYLLQSWDIDTTIVSSVGNDRYGMIIKDEFKKVGVNTKYLETNDTKTFVSYIIANKKNGSRTILIDRDNNLKLKRQTLKEKYDYIYTDGNFADFSYNYILNNKNSISVLDAGRVTDDTLKLCKVVDYIICSNDFAKEYTSINFDYQKIDTLKKVYDKIQNSYKGKLIITLEKYGAFVKLEDTYHLIPSIKVKAVDSTGAGDIFHGSFLYFISQKYDILDAIKYANIAGGISVTKIGGRNSIPTLEEVINYE